MIRRERQRDFQNPDRWLISYADFITLLFAFFVVMYSISQVNEGKYRVLSESLVAAFDIPESSLQPIQIGEINRSDVPYQNTRNNLPGSEQPGFEETEGLQQADANQLQQLNATAKQTAEQFKSLQQNLSSELENLISQGVVNIKATEDWIEIELPSGLLFSSGSDSLASTALILMQEIATIINSSNNLLRIRGFTDDIPVEGGKFSSNWALSAARAVSVVQLLQRLNVEPARLALEGYGEYAPKVENDNNQSRAQNRRVVIAISRYVRGVATPLPKAAEVEVEKPAEETFELIRAPDGRLIIRGKNVPEESSNP
jgi:chemotaxis protein MotB